MLEIKDFLLEMNGIIQLAQNAYDHKNYLELNYLMGRMQGYSMLIHELARKEQNGSIENPKSV